MVLAAGHGTGLDPTVCPLRCAPANSLKQLLISAPRWILRVARQPPGLQRSPQPEARLRGSAAKARRQVSTPHKTQHMTFSLRSIENTGRQRSASDHFSLDDHPATKRKRFHDFHSQDIEAFSSANSMQVDHVTIPMVSSDDILVQVRTLSVKILLKGIWLRSSTEKTRLVSRHLP